MAGTEAMPFSRVASWLTPWFHVTRWTFLCRIAGALSEGSSSGDSDDKWRRSKFVVGPYKDTNRVSTARNIAGKVEDGVSLPGYPAIIGVFICNDQCSSEPMPVCSVGWSQKPWWAKCAVGRRHAEVLVSDDSHRTGFWKGYGLQSCGGLCIAV